MKCDTSITSVGSANQFQLLQKELLTDLIRLSFETALVIPCHPTNGSGNGSPNTPEHPGLAYRDECRRTCNLNSHPYREIDGFQKWERDVSQWVTTKAYDDIQHHNECVLVLMRLLDGSADLSELKEHVRAENGDVERVEDAVQRLLSHQILIRRRKDGRYEAAEQAKSHILPVLD